MSFDNFDFDDCEIIIISNENENFEDQLVQTKMKSELEEGNMNGDFTKIHRTSEIHEVEVNIKKEDFAKRCRTCLSDGNLLSIFNSKVTEDSNVTIDQLLRICATMQVEEEDGLPQNICPTCVRRLMKIYLFRKRCHLNETMFRLILLNAQEELDEEGEDSSDKKEEPVSDYDSDTKNETKEDADKDSEEYEFQVIVSQSDNDEIDASYDTDNVMNDSQNADNTESQICINDTNNTKASNRKQKQHFKCYKCVLHFDNREDYLKHRREAKHSAHKIYPCKVCNKMFSSSKLKQHMRTHTKEKPFVCAFCKEAFSLSGNLKRHMMIHTGERPHVCHICGKGFIQATSLQAHSKTHSSGNTHITQPGSYKFTCKFCDRGFKRIVPYTLHLKRHDPNCLDAEEKLQKGTTTEEKPYKCDICNKHYGTKHLLKNHAKIHGDRHFLCSGCGKGFVTNAALLSHLRTHTGERPFVCNICNKSFSYVGSYETHMLIHTGFKPYSCNVCGRNFTQQPHLTCHMRTHSGERPYVCPYCGKSFALNGNLTVHIRTHTGETPYSCSFCGRGFYDSSSRNKHQKSHENLDTKYLIPKTEKAKDGVDTNSKYEIEYKPDDHKLILENTLPCKD